MSGNLGVRNWDQSLVTRCQTIQYLGAISMGRRVNDMLYGLFIASGAFAGFRREALLSVGGWAAGPGEDGDISTRLRRAGWHVRFQPEAWAMTDVPVTLTALVRQRVRWGRSFAMGRLRKHIAILNPFHRWFSLERALGTIDAIFFEVVRPVAYLVYVAWLIDTYGQNAWMMIAIVVSFYLMFSHLLFTVVSIVEGQYGRLILLPYVTAAALLNAFVLRVVTIYATLTELLWRKGYRDSFVPPRVQARIDWY